MTFLHLLRIDRLFGQAEEFGVLAECRRLRLWRAVVRCYPVPAVASMNAGDAAGLTAIPPGFSTMLKDAHPP
jgi:hypothetical protein